MTGTGHALQTALGVVLIAGVAMMMGVAAVSFGWHLGAAGYRRARRWMAHCPVRRCLAAAWRWHRYRSLRWDARRDLDTRYFEPWVDEEMERRRREQFG